MNKFSDMIAWIFWHQIHVLYMSMGLEKKDTLDTLLYPRLDQQEE